ncbi:hypothetical protein JK636_14485 [Clostridium sp. YIM B02515]|uniref:DUF4825 domain-containing protein n=1 Tax=Clostridium rhizosphaerae TaxID=2803861 RepID=A0ABS1TC77_9CLOT|nr:hypothetical protein [Clostridium rhizosphaerae]MBL4936958.1 hypothetical protein [Clostridium rhizosphaerae]
MLSKKKPFMIMGAVLIAAILLSIFGTPKYQSMKINNISSKSLQSKLKEAVSTNSEVDINKLTDFKWDECYVFTPYYPSKQVYEKTGVEWTSYETFIGFLMFHSTENETVNDDQYLMVFKKDNKVVLADKYSLNQMPAIFKLENFKFTSSNAKFTVTTSKQYDGGKVKELVLKE